MPLWPFLLRVLLCVALVLNGTTVAVAAVSMEHQMAATKSVTAPKPAASAHGCHDDEAPASAPLPAGDQAREAAKSGSPEHPAPDCCDNTACNCACVQAAQAGSPVVATGAVVPKNGRLPPPPATRRAEPALPHLIRPPID